MEKFTAIKDEGDGSAFKVDGIRGSRDVGSAGDFAGSQKVDISDRNTDVGDGKFRVSEPKIVEPTQDEKDEATVREALRFFFSPEGQVFREFMLEEIVTVVDASSREALNELALTLGLSNLPTPSIFRALNPKLSESDRRTVQQIRKLVQFLVGDFEGALTSENSDLSTSNRNLSRLQRAQRLLINPNGRSGSGGDNNARLRKLLPVVREYAPQLSEFGSLLIVRLSEKALSRGLNWASGRISTPQRPAFSQ